MLSSLVHPSPHHSLLSLILTKNQLPLIVLLLTTALLTWVLLRGPVGTGVRHLLGQSRAPDMSSTSDMADVSFQVPTVLSWSRLAGDPWSPLSSHLQLGPGWGLF